MSCSGDIRLTRRHLLRSASTIGAAVLFARTSRAAVGSSADAAIAARLAGRTAKLSDRLTLDVPRSFDYGSTVPLAVAVDSPMRADNYVRRIDVFAEGNPFPEVLTVHLTPQCGEARVASRFRLEKGDHRIHALAELSDGTLLRAYSDVKTTIGGCGTDGDVGPTTPQPTPVPRVKLPERVEQGEIVDVPSMIAHRMETGFRTDKAGNLLARHIINKMECRYAGMIVFAAELTPAVAANAYLKFPIRATQTGDVAFAWYEDGGAVYRATRLIAVD